MLDRSVFLASALSSELRLFLDVLKPDFVIGNNRIEKTFNFLITNSYTLSKANHLLRIPWGPIGQQSASPNRNQARPLTVVADEAYQRLLGRLEESFACKSNLGCFTKPSTPIYKDACRIAISC